MQEKNPITAIKEKRAYALDALRGFAILAMVLSGTISYKILPDWMYHAQEPPPTHTFHPNLPGLTWVDVVFPLFLFSMGSSIPLALSRRLAKGFSTNQVILYILKRGCLLGTFAIFLQHIRPLTINPNPTQETWWIALLGFLILFFMFMRWSVDVRFKLYAKWITVIASIAAIILVSNLQYPDGSGFSLYRSDIILIVLANMSVFGAIAWFFTQNNSLFRLGLLGLLIAVRLSSTVPGSWIAEIWSSSPVPWLFRFDYLKYLFIVIPGTIAGDFILGWLKDSTNEEREVLQLNWNQPHLFSIILLILTICLELLIGLQARLVWQTTLLSIVFCSIGWLLFKNPGNQTERLLQIFYQWGVYWLALGLLFEPFENGIKKDPSTLSYYFITDAIALFLLILFTLVIDIFNQRKHLQFLINNGQNPMIAYAAFANLLWPILKLTNIESFILHHTLSPLTGLFKGVIYTLLVGFYVSFCTKLKLFWRT
jgi:predicted acyltransferase